MAAKISSEAAAEILETIAQISYSLGFSGGLRPTQWTALRFFANSEERARTVGNFAKYNKTSPSSASQTINALVARDLLRRVWVEADRRTHRLIVAPGGRKLLRADPLRHLVQAIEEMPERRRFEFADHLRFLLLAMTERFEKDKHQGGDRDAKD